MIIQRNNKYIPYGISNLMGRQKTTTDPLFTQKKTRKRPDNKEDTALQIRLRKQREQIARDLHDGIGSQLTHIISRLEMLVHRNPAFESQLNDLQDFTRETVQQLRETIWVLNQGEIPYGSLTERIRGLLTRISADAGCPTIKLTAYGEASLLLDPRLASSIFRIVQEGVNNAMKYAECSDISVCLATDEQSLTLVVSDNGKGFCAENVPQGYGLLNFKTRTEELDGTFLLTSSTDGTEVLIEFPLPKKYVR
ncbi:sensor histidine kinase [Persicitalea sp.]|uniref:sensor histidine kinase n=1 Tax=Persicitalea sp. TaxID=3100273 RepID=UPI00359383CB